MFINRIEGLPSQDSPERWLRGNYGINSDRIDKPSDLVFRGFGEQHDKEEINYISEEILKQ